MVLPDKHKPDSDTVLWMNDVHATKEEAQQAGAVVALARVSTTLPLERLLPSEFIPTWTRSLEAEKKRAQRKEREQEVSHPTND